MLQFYCEIMVRVIVKYYVMINVQRGGLGTLEIVQVITNKIMFNFEQNYYFDK